MEAQMVTEKHFWKCSYFWIKYFNFELVHHDENNQEVWLAHKKKNELVIFNYNIKSAQEIRFTKDKIKEHKQDVSEFLTFEPKKVTLYFITEHNFTDEHLNESGKTTYTVKIIRNEQSLERIMPNLFVKTIYKQDNEKHTLSYFKKRVLNTNPIEKHMLKFAPITYALIIINVIIWLSMILFFNHFTQLSLLDAGGLVHFNVIHGEWYRLVTSIFLHYNFEHILMNMLSLFIFGKIVESIVGHWRMLVIYLFAGIFANFASLSFNITTVSAGASGAIFGLIGALFAFMFISKNFNKKLIGQLLIVLVILIVISLFMTNINVYAHIGGLIGGFLICLLGHYFVSDKNKFWIVVVILLILFVAAQIRIFTIKEDNIYNTIITNEMTQGNYKEAQSMVKHTIKKNYADDETYYLNGLITTTLNSRAEGMADWERGLRYYPNSGILNYELAIANRALDDKSKARKYAKKALKADPHNHDYLNLTKELKD
jgi:rhomboid protease GluP